MSRASRPAGPPRCCRPVAVFRNEQLVDIQRRHWCGRGVEHINPDTWRRT